jgi:MFS family permease
MACLGACSSLGSLLFGRVSDRVGRLPTLGIGALCHATGASLAPIPRIGKMERTCVSTIHA